jgi:1,4-dihydroxy-6-naphthoate synthase
MTLTLGFSPCPNDTFIFDAMMHGKIDTEGLDFEVVMGDVEFLNQKAFRSELDITKLSYHAFAYLTTPYVLLHSGSALGNKCGPLLIAKTIPEAWQQNIEKMHIAIPGKFTTANFLLGYAFANAQHKSEFLFSEIEKVVTEGSVDAGVIIHENRFTYEQHGLKKLIDLGEHWEQTTGFPIPLGGIVARRHFSPDLQAKINRVLRRSVTYAFEHTDDVMPFVRRYAQEMDEAVMRQHIELYVNNYTIDLGEKGKAAVLHLFQKAEDSGFIPIQAHDIFSVNEEEIK